jgi:hypothetical protein
MVPGSMSCTHRAGSRTTPHVRLSVPPGRRGGRVPFRRRPASRRGGTRPWPASAAPRGIFHGRGKGNVGWQSKERVRRGHVSAPMLNCCCCCCCCCCWGARLACQAQSQGRVGRCLHVTGFPFGFSLPLPLCCVAVHRSARYAASRRVRLYGCAGEPAGYLAMTCIGE